MKSICIQTIAGLAITWAASGAGAQTATFQIVASKGTIDTTVATSFTLYVYVSADFGSHVATSEFDLLYSGTGFFVTDIIPQAPLWNLATDLGTFAGPGSGDWLGYAAEQIIFPPQFQPNPDTRFTAHPVLLGSFEVHVAAGVQGTIAWVTSGGATGNGAVSIYDETNGSFTQMRAAGNQVIAGSASITLIPSPSSVGILALGGLAAGRRRR